jgi:regulatory protein
MRRPRGSAEPAPGRGPLAGRITGLEVQAHDPERVNLSLDGRFAFGLSAKVAADAGLKTGDWLSAADVAHLLRQEDEARALQQAYVLLSYRPRSEQEMRQALTRKGHAPETVTAVVDRLRAYHYLDDEAFAASWVENRQRFRPSGGRLLRAELRLKGVTTDVAAQAIDDGAGDERALAFEVGAKKAAAVGDADYAAFGRKVGGFLMRRGFAPDVVWEVVRRLWAARTGESAPPAD